jgi:hypothetical protein
VRRASIVSRRPARPIQAFVSRPSAVATQRRRARSGRRGWTPGRGWWTTRLALGLAFFLSFLLSRITPIPSSPRPWRAPRSSADAALVPSAHPSPIAAHPSVHPSGNRTCPWIRSGRGVDIVHTHLEFSKHAWLGVGRTALHPGSSERWRCPRFISLAWTWGKGRGAVGMDGEARRHASRCRGPVVPPSSSPTHHPRDGASKGTRDESSLSRSFDANALYAWFHQVDDASVPLGHASLCLPRLPIPSLPRRLSVSPSLRLSISPSRRSLLSPCRSRTPSPPRLPS